MKLFFIIFAAILAAASVIAGVIIYQHRQEERGTAQRAAAAAAAENIEDYIKAAIAGARMATLKAEDEEPGSIKADEMRIDLLRQGSANPLLSQSTRTDARQAAAAWEKAIAKWKK